MQYASSFQEQGYFGCENLGLPKGKLPVSRIQIGRREAEIRHTKAFMP